MPKATSSPTPSPAVGQHPRTQDIMQALIEQERLVPQAVHTNGELVQGLYRQDAAWTSALMVSGYVNAFLGIIFAVTFGLTKEDAFQRFLVHNDPHARAAVTNFIGEPYPSGEIYFPATISEMVSDPASASGKCFLGFMSIAAFSLMFSNYATKLRSVSVASARCCKAKCCCLVDHARNIFPSIGILLVAYIYMKPANMSTADAISLWIHTIGALLFIGGYGILEAYCLYLSWRGRVPITPTAFKARAACLAGLAVAGAIFQIGAMVTGKFEALGIEHPDVWRVPTQEDINHAFALNHTFNAYQAQYYKDMGLEMLYDTASDQALAWKKAEFWAEAFAGVFMGLSLCVIWFFADEFQPGYVFSLDDSGCFSNEEDDEEGDDEDED